jgi:hypothetical protein
LPKSREDNVGSAAAMGRRTDLLYDKNFRSEQKYNSVRPGKAQTKNTRPAHSSAQALKFAALLSEIVP